MLPANLHIESIGLESPAISTKASFGKEFVTRGLMGFAAYSSYSDSNSLARF